jgi:Gpi18-like mannosyltransferase
VLLVFVLSRLVFYIAAFVAFWLLPEATEPSRVSVSGSPWLGLHWRWDAVHYYSIAVGGYRFYYTFPMPGNRPTGLPAFFPLVPLLTRMVAMLPHGHAPAPLPIWKAEPLVLAAGVLVANCAALLASWLLFRLACAETGDEATASRTVLYAAIFPLAFYYAVPYSEGLLLATSIGAFHSARHRHWVRAGLWAAAASATRPVGILLLPALAHEVILAWYHSRWRGEIWLRALGGLFVAPLGLLLFMLYLGLRLDDPLAFLHAQANWNHHATLPPVTLWRSIGYALHPSWSSRFGHFARDVMNMVITLGFLAVLLVSWRRWRPAYVLYGLLLFAVILSSASPGENATPSLGRYVMILFPVYITLARWGRRPAIHWTIILLWLPLFALLAALYIRWYFVT